MELADNSTGATGNKAQPSTIELSTIQATLALDRTLLAWVRTSLTLIGFGFTLARFVYDLIEKGELKGVRSAYPREIGIALMVLGISTLIGGAFEYIRFGKRLQNGPKTSLWSVSLAVTIVLVLLTVFLMVGLLLELKPI